MDIKRNIHKIPDRTKLVVGVPRSGMIPAYMIGLILNIKVCSLDEFVHNIEPSNGLRPINTEEGSILIIDDSCGSGASMSAVKEKIRSAGINNPDIKYAAVYCKGGSEAALDIALTTLEFPRIFEWNYMNHSYIEYACFDIDGVLCVDPTEEENDDGEKYKNFILNAKPLYIPKYRVYALVSSRLEKYRTETAAWLEKHNVRYQHLYLLDVPSKEHRQRFNMHAKFKAGVYAELKNAVLFYESERAQAAEIAVLTQKPVFCTATDEYFDYSQGFNFQNALAAAQKREIWARLKNIYKENPSMKRFITQIVKKSVKKLLKKGNA
ncbi:MAG: hypothetical protein LBC77_05655 [Spirochaetaceae bacterium]|jgi:uncharacterized HAD superfamily protein|nr:hypothetical protein [Spirochaetaceae bacterium]